MSATHALAERRPVRPCGRARRPDQPATPEPSNVEVSLHRLDRIVLRPTSDGSANELLDAALGEPVQALPHASLLERRFGQPLGWVQVRSGALVREALDALGAQAATRGDTVFLRERSAPLDVVAHEVTHALQGRNGAAGSGGGVVAENAPQEVEAGAALARTGPLALAVLQAPVRPAEGLAPGAIALLRSGPGPAEDPVIVAAPAAGMAARSLAPPVPAPTPPATEPAAGAPVPAGQATTADGAKAGGAAAAAVVTARSAGEARTAGPGEPLTLPPSQQLTVPSEDTAAREAGEALAGTGGAAAVLRAYADARPTVKAQQAASLSSHLETAMAGETEQWQSAVPGLEAHLRGVEGPPPAALHVEAPKAVELELEPEVVPPAPEPELPAVPEPAPFTANDQVSGAFSRLTEPPPEQLADAIGNSLSEVRTSDPSVPRSPGPPPAIPLGGETDPARIAGQEATGKALVSGARADVARAILDGPGPEQVQPVTVREAYAIEAVEPPAPAPLDVPAGPAVYLALNLPPDVQTAFDEQQQAAMQEDMVAATAKAEEVTVARDTARDEAVATAQAGAAELNSTAQQDQDGAVANARTTIQAQRQASIDAQQTEVSRIEKDVADRRRLDEGKIGAQVQAGQKAIDDSYVQGEKDIAGQVAEGERKAQAEREQAQRDAENEGWWDRAVSFVRDAFNALIAAIGEILDAVRKAVNRALDALMAFALSVIDRVASFIKDAIGAFGEFLKFAVNTLIGTFFPGLAAKLNAAIDKAVAAAQSAVDVVAEGLKASVRALVEGLRAGINAAINAFQAGISIAISLVSAALTGDWGMLAKKVLAAALRLIGVDPEAFYAFVGRAQETFEIIINDPLAFLSRLVSAVVGGVQRFAGRFGDHLKKGVVGWLTGTLGGAGITLPRTLDLIGVLELSRQILGLTWERIRAKAVKLIGERNVARLEFIGGYITTLINEGWSGLWNKIGADVGGLLDMVFDGIKSFLLERVVLAIIKKIPALFGPVGAIVQLVMTAWNLYEFLRDQLSRIAALVKTVVDSIGDIARGILTAASAKVEEVLGNLVPIALDLLARVLGLGDVGQDVRKIVGKVQAFIEKAIEGLITRVIGLFTGKGKGGGAKPDARAGAAGPEGSETIDEPLRIAGENHTLRAIIVGGQATILMASDTFLGVLIQLNHLLKILRKLYTAKGGQFYGTPRAGQFEQDFKTIEDTAHVLIADVQKETDPARERVAVTRAISQLKKMFNALGLAEARQPEDVNLPAHKARGQAERRWGRALWYEVDPLSVRSLGKGGASGLGIPGISILPGYDKGHLVARSLGGAGSFVNMAPMAVATNRTWIGVRSIEDSVFKALTRTQNVPEAAPGYVMSYRTKCTYNDAAGLESELIRRVAAAPGVQERLFDIAETAMDIDDGDLVGALERTGPQANGPEAALAGNVRRRLAFYFMPKRFTVAVEIKQQPERKDFRQPIAASQTVDNHIGSNVRWQ